VARDRVGWLRVAVALAATGLVLAPATRAAEGPTRNRILDSEAGSLSGWQGSGFEIARFGQANTPPEPLNPDGRPTGLLFKALFGGASITQTDTLADLSGAIDAGAQRLWIEGRFGGSGSGRDGAYMTVELVGEAGEPIGGAYQLGPASAHDRLDKTLLVPCEGTIAVPPGVRAARVTLHAREPSGQPSTGIADSLALRAEPPNRPAIGISPPVYEGQRLTYASGGEGPNCEHLVLTPISRPVRVSAITLTRSRIAFRVSAAAKIDVTIERVGGADGGAHADRSRTRTIELTLVARAPGALAGRLRPPLAAGRYRVTLRVVGTGGPSAATRVTRLLSVR
jgi:hypothetical protein